MRAVLDRVWLMPDDVLLLLLLVVVLLLVMGCQERVRRMAER